LILPLGSQFETLLQKELSFKYLARRDMAGALAQTISAIVCAILGFGVWALAYGYLIGAVVRTGLLVPVGLGRFRPRLRFNLGDLRGYFAFGLCQVGERTACYLGQRSDQILIGSLLGTDALGYYSFAFNLAAQPLSRLNPVVSRVAFPVFSRVQNDVARLKRGYMRMVGVITACNAPLLVGLAATAPWAIPLLFGAKWAPSIVLVQMLSFVTLLRSINNPIGTVQCAKGRADLGVGWQTLTLVLSSATVYVCCHRGDVALVALGLLLLQIGLAVLLYILFVRPLLGRCVAEYTSVAGKPTVIALGMGLIVLLVTYVLDLHGITAFATQIAIGAAVYALLLRMLHPRAFADCKAALLYR
jgi:O-antigen/teichoic acid export membrane protein